MTTKTQLVLYVWPGRWNLPSIDTGCIETILFLQLTCPGRYSIVETTDLDASPNGYLPYLVHRQVIVASAPSIISYIKSLSVELLTLSDEDEEESLPPINTSIDDSLSILDRSKKLAWRAYIEGQLGNLVAHSLYVLEPNYTFIHKTLASMFPLPQRYYVPRRIRDSYKPRLEAAGLWHVIDEEEQEDNVEKELHGNRLTREYRRTVRKSFDKVQFYDKAKPVFDILDNLIKQKDFIFGDRPSTIDLTLASRILLVCGAPLPDSIIKDMLTSSYPSLIAHAARVHALAFSASNPPPNIMEPKNLNFFQVLRGSLKNLKRHILTDHLETEEDKKFRRYRYGWYTLTALTAIGYLAVLRLNSIVVIVAQKDEVQDVPQTAEQTSKEESQDQEEEKGMEDETLEEIEEELGEDISGEDPEA
ncbi:hypothetical protein Clacol_006909 [Clathrus columnatus]|uniref:Uncharacterized protein n=1 Tax=Clathrus columnatus TaxID=1419009 RepID=A0AAV5AII0_9AGAM|nr:hypothetical protein Clacol_006909 [Clathrus columnatus]